jgi:hypothetical protein
MGRGAIVLPEAPGADPPRRLTRRSWSARFALFMSLIALLMKLAPVVDLRAVSSASITPNITAPIAVFMGAPAEKK